MKFLVREVEMMRGGRRMLMTVWRSRKISGGSKWGLSAKRNRPTFDLFRWRRVEYQLRPFILKITEFKCLLRLFKNMREAHNEQ